MCTDKFRTTAEAMARLHGFEGYRFVTVPHPIASLELRELAALAAATVDEVLTIWEVQE